jgi:hypothetical protein
MNRNFAGRNLPGTKRMCLLVGIGLFASTAPAQTLTVLQAFSSPVILTNQDGANPIAGLSSMGDVLCETTVNGGRYAAGTAFCLSTNGTSFNAFRSFTNQPDAGDPQSDLVLLPNQFYGTSFGGGANGTGAVFSLTLPVIVPATITNIVRNLDGSITLSFLGSPNSTNVVWAATNLLSANWQDLSTNVADGGGAWQFTDTNAIQFPARFYRSYSF